MVKLRYRISELIQDLRFAIQRFRRGYDDRAIWGLYEYVRDIAIPVLKKYKERGCYPSSMSSKEWQKILNKMIEGFEANIKIDKLSVGDYKTFKKNYDKLEKKQTEGAKLFGEHFYYLWD